MPVKLASTAAGDGQAVRRAVVIGIGRYRGRAELPYAPTDAQRVAAALRARGYEVTALHDGEGGEARGAITAARVLAEVRRTVAASDEDDVVVVYACCHGDRFGGRPYLTMADTPVRGRGARGMPLAALFAALRGRTRWIAVFLDACRMGLGLDPSVGVAAQHVDDKAGGFAFLSGSRADGMSQDDRDTGVFTACLVAGLDGAAADAEGAVRFSALARHVQDGVEAWRRGPVGALRKSAQAAIVRLEVADLAIVPPFPFHELAPRSAGKVTSAACSSHGLVATTDTRSMLRVWDVATRAQVLAQSMYERVVAGRRPYGYYGGAAFSPDGAVLAACAGEGTVRAWTMATGKEVAIDAGVGCMATKLAWHPDGRTLAVGAEDGVHLFRRHADGSLKAGRVLTGHAGTVWALAFAADGMLLTGAEDHEVRQWRIADGATVGRWHLDGPVWAVAASPGGHLIATGGVDQSLKVKNPVRLWARTSGALVRVLAEHGGGVTGLAFSPDGRYLATACGDGAARLWRVADGQRVRALSVAVPGQAERPGACAVAFCADGAQLFVGFGDGRGRLYAIDRAP